MTTLSGPRPEAGLGTRVVTLLGTAGAMLPVELARYFDVEELEVRDLLSRLMHSRHVRFSKDYWVHYESTGLFKPDFDRPAAPGGHSGPPCPDSCTPRAPERMPL